LRQGAVDAVVLDATDNDSVGRQGDSASGTFPNESDVMPLAVVDGQVDTEGKEYIFNGSGLLAVACCSWEQSDMNTGAVNLGHDALVARYVGRVDGVEGENVASIVAVRELDPEGESEVR
jgi:hypothetical protein